jgi:hypothetical protein
MESASTILGLHEGIGDENGTSSAPAWEYPPVECLKALLPGEVAVPGSQEDWECEFHCSLADTRGTLTQSLTIP